MHIDQSSNTLLGISYNTKESKCPPPADIPTYSRPPAFKTSASLMIGTEGSRVKTELAHKPTGSEGEAQPGFWSKYWPYLVPIPIVLLLVAMGNVDEPQQGGQGRGAARR